MITPTSRYLIARIENGLPADIWPAPDRKTARIVAEGMAFQNPAGDFRYYEQQTPRKRPRTSLGVQ